MLPQHILLNSNSDQDEQLHAAAGADGVSDASNADTAASRAAGKRKRNASAQPTAKPTAMQKKRKSTKADTQPEAPHVPQMSAQVSQALDFLDEQLGSLCP